MQYRLVMQVVRLRKRPKSCRLTSSKSRCCSHAKLVLSERDLAWARPLMLARKTS